MTAAPTQALATFAAELDPAALPTAVREKLGWLLLDYLRVASIGARLPWAAWARRYAGVVAKPGGAHMLFWPDKLNPQHATFVNVAFGSSFDADDTHVGAMLHPGVASWAAALACAQETGVPGREVVAAVTAGYESAIRVGLSVQPAHFRRGFQSTGTCVGFGTAAAAGRLLLNGRDGPRRIAEALGLAGGYAGGLAQFYFSGASAKRIQAAHAAQSGVAAALLAQSGFSGPTDIIEGSGGFARAYAGEWNESLIEDGLGAHWHLMDVLVKCHAAAARVAAGIDAMLALRRQHGFAADDIAAITLGIPAIIQGRLTNPHPKDLQAAQMCLPFSVALAAKVKLPPDEVPALTVGDYEAGLADRALHDLETRTTIALDGEVEAASNALSTAARVRVRLRDGRELMTLVKAPRGSAGNPLRPDEHAARFTAELAPRAGEAACGEIVAMSRDLDTLDARRLGEMLNS
jgi:2-methylcitrate dehydratase PrpD